MWLALNLGDGVLSYYGFYEQFPALAHLEDGLILVVGPLLYFYTLSMIYMDFSFRKYHALHLLPFILVTVIYQTYYHLQPVEDQKLIQTAITQQQLPVVFYVVISLIYLQVGAYLCYSFSEVHRYRAKIKDRFSSIDKINLDWLAFMLWFVLVVFLISVVYTFLPATGLRRVFEESIMVPFCGIFIFTNAVVWKGLKQPEIFSGIEYAGTEERKYSGSPLTDNEKAQILQRLEHIVRAEKPYLQSDLTIDQLAEKINTSSKKLSQTINASFRQNFFDYVNTYRIEEAKRIMKESLDPKLTVLEVMYQSGFNSKSSFNSIFRKETGRTPSEFRRLLPGL